MAKRYIQKYLITEAIFDAAEHVHLCCLTYKIQHEFGYFVLTKMSLAGNNCVTQNLRIQVENAEVTAGRRMVIHVDKRVEE